MLRSPIGIADYLVAMDVLQAEEPRLRRRIAELLGLATPAAPPPSPDDRSEEQVPGLPPATVRPALAISQRQQTPVRTMPTVEAPLRVDQLEQQQIELSWPRDLPASPHDEGSLASRPAVPPLLPPLLERGIVQLLLASERAGGELDLDAALIACTRLQLEAPLPVRPELSVHGGTDLLIDVSDALAPYADDIDRLLLLAEHVGGPATRILYFEHCPGRGVFTEEEPPGLYRSEHRRIVLVGSFGASPMRVSAGVEEWRSALDDLREQGEVVGLCPFEAGRAAFAGLVPMVPWTETTTTTIVTRVLEAGRWSTSTS